MCRASLTRAIEFSAGHRYRRTDWSDEQNQERFGRYAGDSGHGHNYRCEVTVQGDIDPETGMLIDLELLDALLQKHVIDPFDHEFLNDVADFDGGRLVPTTENICRIIWKRLEPELLPACSLRRVRVVEEPDLWADYSGD